MKRIMLIALASLFVVGCASEGEAGLLNDYEVKSIKDLINSAEPAVGWAYDMEDEKSTTYVSIELISYNRKKLGLGSLRIGYTGENATSPEAIAGSIDLSVPNIIATLIPEQLKGFKANLQVLSILPSIGIMAGYDLDEEDFMWGPTVGGKLSF